MKENCTVNYQQTVNTDEVEMLRNLPLNLLNFLNGIIHLAFLELSNIIFRDISIEPSQAARMCRLAWLYNNGKG